MRYVCTLVAVRCMVYCPDAHVFMYNGGLVLGAGVQLKYMVVHHKYAAEVCRPAPSVSVSFLEICRNVLVVMLVRAGPYSAKAIVAAWQLAVS